MIDAVAHPPLDLEAAVAGVEGKFPDGSVVEEMARDDLAAGEGALHPGQGVGLEMPRGIIARGARGVAVAEIHLQLKPRRLRGIQRQRQRKRTAPLSVLVRGRKIAARHEPMIGFLLPGKMPAGPCHRDRCAEHPRKREARVRRVQLQRAAAAREREFAAHVDCARQILVRLRGDTREIHRERDVVGRTGFADEAQLEAIERALGPERRPQREQLVLRWREQRIFRAGARGAAAQTRDEGADVGKIHVLDLGLERALLLPHAQAPGGPGRSAQAERQVGKVEPPAVVLGLPAQPRLRLAEGNRRAETPERKREVQNRNHALHFAWARLLPLAPKLHGETPAERLGQILAHDARQRLGAHVLGAQSDLAAPMLVEEGVAGDVRRDGALAAHARG